MNQQWQDFLESQTGRVSSIVDPLDLQNPEPALLFDLSTLSLIRVSGEDALDFLHAQLSCDLLKLQVNHSIHGAWCNIKGRVIVSLIIHRREQDFLILLDRDLAPAFIKRLGMFVLRSKVSINDLSDELVGLAVAGVASRPSELTTWLQEADATAFEVPAMSIPGINVVIAPMEQARTLWLQLSEALTTVSAANWDCLCILNGLAWVKPGSSEEFLPQTLNMDIHGGLSFDKGCYPGQEIVARMHFRGKLKQRSFAGTVVTDAAPQIASNIYQQGREQSAGQIVNTYNFADNEHLLLFSLDLDKLETDLRLGSLEGPEITVLALPWNPALS